MDVLCLQNALFEILYEQQNLPQHRYVWKLALLQLFDKENQVNKLAAKYLFTTEGHLFPISQKFREKVWEQETPVKTDRDTKMGSKTVVDVRTNASFSIVSKYRNKV